MKTKRTQEFTLRANPRPIRQGERVTPAGAGITLRGPATWSDGTPVTLVYVQLAVVGEWKGHSAGPFSMTVETFDECCRSFHQRGLPLAFDYEHASEADATSGTIPTSGAPACGWIHDLVNRGPDGLWALVEWLDDARDQIRAGKYAYVSPALRLGGKDPVTGQPSGARITSAALTNQPFLSQLPALIAASSRVALDHHAKIKAALVDHANCTDAACASLHAACCAMLDDQDGDGGDVAMRLTMAEGEVAKATLLLRERDERIAGQDAELVELRADKTRRDEAELVRAVDLAFDLWRDRRKLSDSDLPLLLKMARANRASFDKMFPNDVAPRYRHLLKDLVPPARRELPDETPSERVRRSMREEGLTATEGMLRQATGRMEPGDQGDLSAIRAVMRDTGISFTEATLRAAGARPRAR